MTDHILDTIDPYLLGSRLKVAREQAGLSVEQTLKLLEEQKHLVMTSFSLLGIEEGSLRPTATSLVILSEVYGLPVSDLVREEGARPEHPVIILDLYRKGEISEGLAAHWLKIDRLALRTLLEQHKDDEEEKES